LTGKVSITMKRLIKDLIILSIIHSMGTTTTITTITTITLPLCSKQQWKQLINRLHINHSRMTPVMSPSPIKKEITTPHVNLLQTSLNNSYSQPLNDRLKSIRTTKKMVSSCLNIMFHLLMFQRHQNKRLFNLRQLS